MKVKVLIMPRKALQTAYSANCFHQLTEPSRLEAGKSELNAKRKTTKLSLAGY